MVNSKTSLNNQKQCIQFIYNEFLRQKHILSQTPSIVFQQIYNELQWQKGEIKELQGGDVFTPMPDTTDGRIPTDHVP
jgi:hypothetical protein